MGGDIDDVMMYRMLMMLMMVITRCDTLCCPVQCLRPSCGRMQSLFQSKHLQDDDHDELMMMPSLIQSKYLQDDEQNM